MKLQLKTISPIHIGTGEALTALEYVVYNNRFYAVPQRVFEDFLATQPNKTQEVNAFADWIGELFHELSDLEALKSRAGKDQQKDFNTRLRNLNAAVNTLAFVDTRQKRNEYIQFLRKKSPMQTDLPFEPNQHKNSGFSGQVRTALKCNNRPFLPGSSLKGALRTALFYYWLSNHADEKQVEITIKSQLSKAQQAIQKNFKATDREKKQFAKPLEEAAFYCGVEVKKSDKPDTKTNDEKMDLMKLVSFSDAMPLQPDKIANYELADVKLYLVERKQKGKDVTFEASIQPQTSFVEAIPTEQLFHADLRFNIEFLFAIQPFLVAGKDEIKSNNLRHWIGIEKKVKALFGLDIRSLTKANLEEKRRAVEQHLLHCIAQFSRLQLQQHDNWFEHFQKNDKKRGELSEAVQRGWQPVLSLQSQRLMHVGYATGFQGTTALLYFMQDKNRNRQVLFEAVMTLFRIGDKPGSGGKVYKPNIARFPKSRRLVRTKVEATPMGWLQVLLEGEKPAVAAIATNEKKETPAAATFYEGKINPSKPPELDAVVTKSGKPNQVQVYLTQDNMPTLPLQRYPNLLALGTVVRVQPVISKDGKVVQVAFRKVK